MIPGDAQLYDRPSCMPSLVLVFLSRFMSSTDGIPYGFQLFDSWSLIIFSSTLYLQLLFITSSLNKTESGIFIFFVIPVLAKDLFKIFIKWQQLHDGRAASSVFHCLDPFSWLSRLSFLALISLAHGLTWLQYCWPDFKTSNQTNTFEPPHDKTNKMTVPPNEDSDQPAQTDQSLRCALDSDRMPRLIWVFAGRTYHFGGLSRCGSFLLNV